MECRRAFSVVGLYLLAIVGAIAAASSRAHAEPQRGFVYNPVTQRMERESRSPRLATWSPEQDSLGNRKVGYSSTSPSKSRRTDIEQAAYECDPYYDSSSCDDVCVGCGEVACGDCVGGGRVAASIFAGFEATFVKPRFEDNPAFTVTESDGATTESIDEVDFGYDLEFTPRVFVGWQNCHGLGMKITWWQFDHAAANLSDSPPPNGFGEIAPPPFGDVDISSNVPTDVFSAASDLNAYSIDIEATRQASLGSWKIGVAGGVRYATAEQHYLAQLRDSTNDLRGEIDFRHSIEGIGPTISLDAQRPWTPTLSTFCKARGSVLFGDGESRLEAGEDLDLANSFTTTSTTSRDDLLSIAEIQIGVRWQAQPSRGRVLLPFLTTALEGQLWNGAGSASSEDGNLGFFGFNTGVGIDW